MNLSAPDEKSKSLGSGGSMVARLKLKGIDGRAPPGAGAFAKGCKLIISHLYFAVYGQYTAQLC